jgi:FkbM family methyltransferase
VLPYVPFSTRTTFLEADRADACQGSLCTGQEARTALFYGAANVRSPLFGKLASSFLIPFRRAGYGRGWNNVEMRVELIDKHSFIADHLSPDSQVVDLGANDGGFSMEIIRRYGCHVVGVEPVSALVTAMPRHDRFALEPGAITGGEHSVVINVNRTMCASEGIAEAGSTQFTVPGVTLGGLLEKRGIRRVALLKVDIEGAEITLFESASEADLLLVDQITVEYHASFSRGARTRPPCRRSPARTRVPAVGVLARQHGRPLPASAPTYRSGQEGGRPRVLQVRPWYRAAGAAGGRSFPDDRRVASRKRGII